MLQLNSNESAADNCVMPVKIEGSENIRDLFSIFHDGSISEHHFKNGELRIEVEIPYLARLINPAFKKFQVILVGMENVRFVTWPKDSKSEPQIFSDMDTIFKPRLDILKSKIKENQIQVDCNQASPNFDYRGGELYFMVDFVHVTDEAGKSYSIEELDVLCKGYWAGWAKKKIMGAKK